jgi:hypothetical protein
MPLDKRPVKCFSDCALPQLPACCINVRTTLNPLRNLDARIL